jgi:hypothetical protein
MKTFWRISAVFISILSLVACNKEEVPLLEIITCPKEPHPLAEVFIAHAGGEIDGNPYTNSLEALNASYSKGCKLFELDIVESSDGVFVAAHDWLHFKGIADYDGTLDEAPLSEQEFLSQHIHSAYTPMSITAINAWFENHADAILVTDKVNEPKRFAQQFKFKDRLIMELFSWGAVAEAIEVGVKAMPSENLIFGTPDIERILDSLEIKYAAVSRTLLDGREDFFLRLKNSGVKTYVFHINFEAGKDEKYVFENELHLITGMYADDLSLLQAN